MNKLVGEFSGLRVRVFKARLDAPPRLLPYRLHIDRRLARVNLTIMVRRRGRRVGRDPIDQHACKCDDNAKRQ